MKNHEIVISDETSSLLRAIAEGQDDPVFIAELAQVDPSEFRQFISECGEGENREAEQLLKAAESLQLRPSEGKDMHDYSRKRSRSRALNGPFSPRVTLQPRSPFWLIIMLFSGLAISLFYGVSSSVVLWYSGGRSEALPFFAAYTSSFKTLFSLGLILGTAIIVFRSQDVIPQIVETAFTKTELSETSYFLNKRWFLSLRKSITFSAEFIVIAFVLFTYSHFPLSRPGEVLMLMAVCAEYALGVYVGRKLMYTGMMLHSLLSIPVTRNLFKDGRLDMINPYVHVAATLTLIFVYVHMIGYYEGPFLFDSILGQNIKIFLLLPAVIAAPVLLFLNFYPSAVLRKLYAQSIEVDRRRLKEALQSEELSTFEKRYYLIEFDKMSRDQLSTNVRLTLSDLLILAIMLLMVFALILRR
jgi:hypothetical protein